MLKRYAGAALYSMIEKRLKLSKSHPELKYLYFMKHEPGHSGDCAGESRTQCEKRTAFASVSPVLLPFFNHLLGAIHEHILYNKLKEHGKSMVKVGLDKIITNDDLKSLFGDCLKKTGIVFEENDENVNRIWMEITKKVFHARVDEFMEARKELDLESSGKVTDANQSLRDTLKTYSNIKSR